MPWSGKSEYSAGSKKSRFGHRCISVLNNFACFKLKLICFNLNKKVTKDSHTTQESTDYILAFIINKYEHTRKHDIGNNTNAQRRNICERLATYYAWIMKWDVFNEYFWVSTLLTFWCRFNFIKSLMIRSNNHPWDSFTSISRIWTYLHKVFVS